MNFFQPSITPPFLKAVTGSEDYHSENLSGPFPNLLSVRDTAQGVYVWGWSQFRRADEGCQAGGLIGDCLDGRRCEAGMGDAKLAQVYSVQEVCHHVCM